MPEAEAAWLFKIAHNVCLSRRRSSWRRGRIESPADFDAVEELTPAPSRGADELIGLQDVLEQMPESQRRAILLREWQGLSYREIAAELELSQGAVETLIFRARRALAAGLEEPPQPTKRRLLRGADLGSLAAGLKALLVGGGGAAKIAAAVAVVSAATVVAADPVVQRQHHSHGSQPAGTLVPAQPVRTQRVETGSVVVPLAPSAPRVVPVRPAMRAHHPVSSGSMSTPPRPDASAPVSARVEHAAGAGPTAKGHAKLQSGRPSTTSVSSNVAHRASPKAYASRVSPRHSSPKVHAPPLPTPDDVVAVDASVAKPSATPPGAHDGTGKNKDQTG